jgi:hypothetical protein
MPEKYQNNLNKGVDIMKTTKIETPQTIIDALTISGRYRWVVIYGRINGCNLPKQQLLEETHKILYQIHKSRYDKLVEIGAPDIIIENEKRLLSKLETIEIYSKKHQLGRAINKLK